MLQLNNVSKTYMQNGESFQAIDNISFQVKEGEFVSLLGPSGCGKSTVLKIIAGLEQADKQSTVTLQDKKITKPVPEQMMVFQEAALFPWLTVFENVMFGLKIKGKLSKKEMEERVLYFLAMVHMSKFAQHYPHQLSGGMKQRVSIARALALDPQVLLMDEPFSALDEQTRLLLHVELEEIVMKTKKSVVFVTHNIREAVTLSDRILTFSTRPGRIKEEFEIPFGRPRIMTQDLLNIENKILDVLREEIEKVMKNEIDDTYEFKSRTVSSHSTHNMGSGI
ncbi:ABC transporter ATP-binding protein [Bacillus alkalicellulosilyticus]|uniref:ABC transporter ATP-binding protein n=1 Tax=Alkalihalobacterium alkalicellulosilyticum TaxID=1912214 RepID=UPI0009974983|nr:ABC transporter ATP-binding protein [Bacillus alkalicellulosilyticus]